MSLRSALKLDMARVVEGVWFDDFPLNNDAVMDGDKEIKPATQPRFLLGRIAPSNPRYAKALERSLQSIQGKKITTEEDVRAADELFADTVLLGWEHFQPDADGVDMPYTRENALKIIADPAWFDLYTQLRGRASTATKFRVQEVAELTKNS